MLIRGEVDPLIRGIGLILSRLEIEIPAVSGCSKVSLNVNMLRGGCRVVELYPLCMPIIRMNICCRVSEYLKNHEVNMGSRIILGYW